MLCLIVNVKLELIKAVFIFSWLSAFFSAVMTTRSYRHLKTRDFADCLLWSFVYGVLVVLVLLLTYAIREWLRIHV